MVVHICGHSRQQRCHVLRSRCQEPYMKLCAHQDEPRGSYREQQCFIHECTRFCQSKCKHTRCTQRCNIECDRPVCYEKCTRRFECEHYCNGVCGEPCPDCLTCRATPLPPDIRRATEGRKLRNAILVQLKCGHLIMAQALDEYIEKFKQQ